MTNVKALMALAVLAAFTTPAFAGSPAFEPGYGIDVAQNHPDDSKKDRSSERQGKQGTKYEVKTSHDDKFCFAMDSEGQPILPLLKRCT